MHERVRLQGTSLTSCRKLDVRRDCARSIRECLEEQIECEIGASICGQQTSKSGEPAQASSRVVTSPSWSFIDASRFRFEALS